MTTLPNAILIIGPSWVGDMVMAQSLFTELKQQQPDCEIDVLAPGWSLPILERMPEVRAGIEMPVGHGQLQLKNRYRLGQSLKGKYQQAIVLPNSLKSALLPVFAGIPKRTGWKGEVRYGLLNDLRVLDKEALPLMVERFVALGFDKEVFDKGASPKPLPYPRPQLTTDKANQEKLREQFAFKADERTLVLCPGAEFGNAKQWPEEHYAAVASHYIAQGWQVWVLGSANDQGTASRICDQVAQPEACFNLAGQTALVDTIDLIAMADAVVCNDSGLMHIAAAVNTPLVVVYGSTSPGFTPPLSEAVQILQSDIECAPCFERTCPLGHRNCLQQQLPQAVIKKLEQLIN